ncbi:hypothetical protein AALO_G00267620 [Alosa alosa]|uniref:Uncharacterized protein n=1 Tax=Alosa alosa TaxID=278164 RepID=A0AAV6FTK5_9TELE|nr:hypothetical protein AALO_G00267620 [Alosa alosa]
MSAKPLSSARTRGWTSLQTAWVLHGMGKSLTELRQSDVSSGFVDVQVARWRRPYSLLWESKGEPGVRMVQPNSLSLSYPPPPQRSSARPTAFHPHLFI